MTPLVDSILRGGALAGLALAGGGAHVWVEAEGQRHLLGWMHLTLPPVQGPIAAETLRVQTLGLGWTRAEVGSALVLGYADTTLAISSLSGSPSPISAAASLARCSSKRIASSLPERETDVEAIQLFIGVRYLLLAPLYGYLLKTLTLAGGVAELTVSHDGDEIVFEVDAFRAKVRAQVREELDRVATGSRSAIDLSKVADAEAAASRGEWPKVVAILGTWPAPLAIFLRTPEGQMLAPEARSIIAKGLGLLGSACVHLGELEQAEEVFRIGIQYAQEGIAAADLFRRLGEALLVSDRPGEAIGPLRRAIAFGGLALCEGRVFNTSHLRDFPLGRHVVLCCSARRSIAGKHKTSRYRERAAALRVKWRGKLGGVIEMKNVLIATAGLLLASTALAQSGSGGTVTQGFSSFTLGDVGTGASDQPLADFSVGGPGNPDHLFQNWWWFRVQGDSNETAFKNASNWSYSGNTARLEFSTANFDAVVQYSVTSIRNGLGVLTTTCTVFNTSSNPLTLNLFHYADLDMNASASNDSADLNGVNIIRVTDGGNTGWRANYEGTDAYHVASLIHSQVSASAA